MAFHGSKGKPRVIFLDDDRMITGFYKEVLEQDHGYTVEAFSRVSGFMKRLDADRNWDAVVLDVMMPHSDFSRFTYAESDDGLLTGVLLVEHVRKLVAGIPIIILTNRVPEDVEGYLTGQSNLHIKTKFEFPPFEFADFLVGLLNEA